MTTRYTTGKARNSIFKHSTSFHLVKYILLRTLLAVVIWHLLLTWSWLVYRLVNATLS